MKSSLPSIWVASTCTMSPPASLTTSPVAMPTWSSVVQLAVVEPGGAEVVLQLLAARR